MSSPDDEEEEMTMKKEQAKLHLASTSAKRLAVFAKVSKKLDMPLTHLHQIGTGSIASVLQTRALVLPHCGSLEQILTSAISSAAAGGSTSSFSSVLNRPDIFGSSGSSGADFQSNNFLASLRNATEAALTNAGLGACALLLQNEDQHLDPNRGVRSGALTNHGTSTNTFLSDYKERQAKTFLELGQWQDLGEFGVSDFSHREQINSPLLPDSPAEMTSHLDVSLSMNQSNLKAEGGGGPHHQPRKIKAASRIVGFHTALLSALQEGSDECVKTALRFTHTELARGSASFPQGAVQAQIAADVRSYMASGPSTGAAGRQGPRGPPNKQAQTQKQVAAAANYADYILRDSENVEVLSSTSAAASFSAKLTSSSENSAPTAPSFTTSSSVNFPGSTTTPDEFISSNIKYPHSIWSSGTIEPLLEVRRALTLKSRNKAYLSAGCGDTSHVLDLKTLFGGAAEYGVRVEDKRAFATAEKKRSGLKILQKTWEAANKSALLHGKFLRSVRRKPESAINVLASVSTASSCSLIHVGGPATSASALDTAEANLENVKYLNQTISRISRILKQDAQERQTASSSSRGGAAAGHNSALSSSNLRPPLDLPPFREMVDLVRSNFEREYQIASCLWHENSRSQAVGCLKHITESVEHVCSFANL
eukprot:GSA120T00024826001.1